MPVGVCLGCATSEQIPNTSPTAASASSDLYCQAAINACEQLKERMKPIKEANPKDSFPEVRQKQNPALLMLGSITSSASIYGRPA